MRDILYWIRLLIGSQWRSVVEKRSDVGGSRNFENEASWALDHSLNFIKENPFLWLHTCILHPFLLLHSAYTCYILRPFLWLHTAYTCCILHPWLHMVYICCILHPFLCPHTAYRCCILHPFLWFLTAYCYCNLQPWLHTANDSIRRTLVSYSHCYDSIRPTLVVSYIHSYEYIRRTAVVYYVQSYDSIGRFSEAGLLEWMRFVIFRERSRERSQRTSGPISE